MDSQDEYVLLLPRYGNKALTKDCRQPLAPINTMRWRRRMQLCSLAVRQKGQDFQRRKIPV